MLRTLSALARGRSAAAMLLALSALVAPPALAAADPHSLANLDAFRVRHLDLSLDVDFAQRRLSGTVDLTVERLGAAAGELVLDSSALAIRQAWLVEAGRPTRELSSARARPRPSSASRSRSRCRRAPRARRSRCASPTRPRRTPAACSG